MIVSETCDLTAVGWLTQIEARNGTVVCALGDTQDESRDNALACLRLEQDGDE